MKYWPEGAGNFDSFHNAGTKSANLLHNVMYDGFTVIYCCGYDIDSSGCMVFVRESNCEAWFTLSKQVLDM